MTGTSGLDQGSILLWPFTGVFGAHVVVNGRSVAEMIRKFPSSCGYNIGVDKIL